MEQTEVQAPTTVQIVLGGRPLSDQVRASLEAVRVAREAAHERARRQTMRARIWFVTVAAVAAVATIALGPRVARWRHAAAPATTQARPSVAPALPARPAPAIAPPAAAPATAEMAARPARRPDAPERVAVEAPAVAARAPAPLRRPAAAATASATASASEQACDTGLIGKTPWLLSPEACARAFDADPSNASLALGIAHAEHVRGHGAEAAEWAKRALALDASAAEAYVIIARTEADAGHADEARAAYGRYLDLAPRGWHQAEARTGVRRAGSARVGASSRSPAR